MPDGHGMTDGLLAGGGSDLGDLFVIVLVVIASTGPVGCCCVTAFVGAMAGTNWDPMSSSRSGALAN